MKKTRIWLITEGSSALGLTLIYAILDAGDLIVATTSKGNSSLLNEAFGDQRNIRFWNLNAVDERMCRLTIAEMVAHFGGIDILVSEAGGGLLPVFEECSEDLQIERYQKNIASMLNITKSVLPYMFKQSYGQLIHIFSTNVLSVHKGKEQRPGDEGDARRSASSIACELARYGISTSALLPDQKYCRISPAYRRFGNQPIIPSLVLRAADSREPELYFSQQDAALELFENRYNQAAFGFQFF